MQTISKYVAAFILALASSYFGPSESQHHEEKEVQIRVQIIKSSPCVSDTVLFDDQDLLS